MKTIKHNKTPKFSNGDLQKELEKIKRYDSLKIKKDEYKDENTTTYTVEVNDNSYLYANSKERNSDLNLLKTYFK